jgi:hypothetical protein
MCDTAVGQLFILFIKYMPPEGIPTLTKWWGLCGHMIPRAMLAVAYATGRASHARQVKGDDLVLQVGGLALG